MYARHLGLALVIVATTASAGQQRYYFAHKYIVGQTDRYVVTTYITSPMAMTMSMTMSQTVLKTYPSGDADVKAKYSGMSMMMNGKPMPDPTGGAAKGGQEVTMRLDKYGNPAGGAQTGGAMMGMDMGMGSGINGLAQGLIMGKTIPFQVASKNGQGPSIKGSGRLASIAKGIARIDQTFDISVGQSNMTMHGTGSYYLRVKDGMMLSGDMKMTGSIMGATTQTHVVIKRQ